MEDDIKAMREEIAKLRERVAVLEAARPPLAWDYAKLGVPHVGTPMPFYSHANHPPAVCPSGSPFSVSG